jgi:hypothetical protein
MPSAPLPPPAPPPRSRWRCVLPFRRPHPPAVSRNASAIAATKSLFRKCVFRPRSPPIAIAALVDLSEGSHAVEPLSEVVAVCDAPRTGRYRRVALGSSGSCASGECSSFDYRSRGNSARTSPWVEFARELEHAVQPPRLRASAGSSATGAIARVDPLGLRVRSKPAYPAQQDRPVSFFIDCLPSRNSTAK